MASLHALRCNRTAACAFTWRLETRYAEVTPFFACASIMLQICPSDAALWQPGLCLSLCYIDATLRLSLGTQMRPEGGLGLRFAATSATRKALQSLLPPGPGLPALLGRLPASSARLRCLVAYTSLHCSITCSGYPTRFRITPV